MSIFSKSEKRYYPYFILYFSKIKKCIVMLCVVNRNLLSVCV